MTGPLIIAVVETDTAGLSTLVAVIVYVPTTLGEVHTLPLKIPEEALQVSLFVTPPVAVAAKLTSPGAAVRFAGVIGGIATLVGVTMQGVETTFPLESVTVRV